MCMNSYVQICTYKIVLKNEFPYKFMYVNSYNTNSYKRIHTNLWSTETPKNFRVSKKGFPPWAQVHRNVYV